MEEGQNLNDHPTTLSEVEHYYQEREQRLLEKLHQQEAALTVAEQTLKQLIKNQKAQLDETNQLHATQERAFKEELYRDSLTGAYNRRYYEEVVRKSIGPAGIALLDVDDFQDMQRCIRALRRRYGTENGDKSHSILYPGVGSAHPLRRRRVSAGLTRHSGRFFADPNWNRSTRPHRWHLYPAIRISASR